MSFSDLTLVQYKDRVRDFTLSTSTPFVLEEEPPLGYQGFGDALSDGQRCHYVVLDSNGTWALYRGDYSATGISISALTFLAGSATAPAFSSERKEIFLVAAGISYEELIDEIARLGTLAASSVPFPISAGGTSASTAAGARTALGLAIGSDVQAWDHVLTGFAALTTADHIPYFSAASTVSSFITQAYGRSLLNTGNEAALKALINAEAGIDFQAWDVVLDGFAALSAASQVPFFSAASTVSSFGSQAYGRTLLDVASEAAFKALINAEAGVDFQAWDVVLDGFAALTTASHVPFFSAASTVSSFGSQAYGRSLLDTANEAGLKALINAEAGVDFQAWNAQLQAHADLAANGIITRTAATTISARSVAAGLGITLTNGDGVAGNPTVALNISGLTTATDIDTAADFLPYYDSSASTIKKTLASAIGGSGGGDWTLIQAQNPSGAASVDFTTGLDGTYTNYCIVGTLLPATDDVEIWLRTDVSGGASFDAGASDYGVGYRAVAPTAGEASTAAVAQIRVAGAPAASNAVSNARGGCRFEIYFDLGSASKYPMFDIKSMWSVAAGDDRVGSLQGGGQRNSTAVINAVRILAESGNITGHLGLYGLSEA